MSYTSRRCRGYCDSICTHFQRAWMESLTVRMPLFSSVARCLILFLTCCVLSACIECSLADTVISHLTYIPAIAHGRPTTLQALVRLPPRATVQLSMEVAKAFLCYTEHPPDAQCGWDLPPAVLVPVNISAPLDQSGIHGASAFVPTGSRVYTNTLLVDLAMPDFSMPYNVIIFTCTLVAGIFGTVFNTLTRWWIVVRIKA